MDYHKLLENAKEVSKNAYVKYSNFEVGACLITKFGKIYSGCNFENSSYGLTICAERNAVGSAIADGEQIISAIAIYSPKKRDCLPCGACRQVLSEFQDENGIDVITEGDNDIIVRKLDELFPQGFIL